MQKLAFFAFKNPLKDVEMGGTTSKDRKGTTQKDKQTGFLNFLIKIFGYLAMVLCLLTVLFASLANVLKGVFHSIAESIVHVKESRQWFTVIEYASYATVALIIALFAKNQKVYVNVIMAFLAFGVFITGHALYFAADMNGGLSKNLLFLIEFGLLCWKVKRLKPSSKTRI